MSIYSWIISTNNIFFLNNKKIMEPKFLYIIYLIAVLILLAPAFLVNNTNTKVLFKNIALWGIVVLVIIFFIKYFGLHHFIK